MTKLVTDSLIRGLVPGIPAIVIGEWELFTDKRIMALYSDFSYQVYLRSDTNTEDASSSPGTPKVNTVGPRIGKPSHN